MIFSLRPEGIGEYTPEERYNVPWASCTLGRIGCPSGTRHTYYRWRLPARP
jgi:hypothetical protein